MTVLRCSQARRSRLSAMTTKRARSLSVGDVIVHARRQRTVLDAITFRVDVDRAEWTDVMTLDGGRLLLDADTEVRVLPPFAATPHARR